MSSPAAWRWLPSGATWLVMGTVLLAQDPSVRVAVPRVDVRAEASDRSPILGRATYGMELPVHRTEGDWLAVEVPPTPGRDDVRLVGYVHVAAIARSSDSAASATLPVSSRGISVSTDVGARTVTLAPTASRAVPLAGAINSIAAAASSGTLADALLGRTPMPADPTSLIAWTWTIPPGAVLSEIAVRRPSFFVSYNRVAGLNAAEFVPAIVKIVPATGSDWRLLSLARGRVDAATREQADWLVLRDLKQTVVPVTLGGSGPGLVTMQLAAALAPGDYAVVLRPFYLQRYAGARILSSDREGVAFSLAWAFTVK